MQNENNLKKKLTLHAMIGNGMVLQRGENVRIWGFSENLKEVTVRFKEKLYKTKSDENGKWFVMLQKSEAGGPYEMEIESGKEKITVHNILVGEVWICSGQSNMQLPMERVKDKYPEIIKNFKNDNIREFIVEEHYNFHNEEENVEKGEWKPVNSETIGDFTASGFFFAKKLYETYNVPVGIIKMAIGGAHVEAWMSRESLMDYPQKLKLIDRYCDDEFVKREAEEQDNRERKWLQKLDSDDKGLADKNLPWYAENIDDSDWGKIKIPAYLKDTFLSAEHGAFWFRKEIDLPREFEGKEARLFLGRLVDADKAYVNGEFVGTTGYRYPPRKYDVRKGLLKAGRNVIAIRLISYSGEAEFVRQKQYQLIFKDKTFDISGVWKCRVGAYEEELPERSFLHTFPAGLYNGMFAPASNYTAKGVIFYQGESNTDHPDDYKDLFIKMIEAWRKKIGKSDMPFIFVQLPNYLETENKEAINKWPLIREAQRQSLLVKNTAMVVTIDIGEWNDLHPLDKEDVGNRLALAARKVAYGETDLVISGPLFEKLEIKGEKAVVSFKKTGSDLVSNDGEKLRNFEIAGEDGIFYDANAEIDGSKVTVSCEKVKSPKAVKYAFHDCPKKVNFYNKEGLPASPFFANISKGKNLL